VSRLPESMPLPTPAAAPAPAAERMTLAYLGDPNSVHVRRWLAYFADRGHAVHLLTSTGEAVHEPLDPRIHLHPFRAWPRLRIPGASRFVTSVSLRLVLRQIRPDVLHAHYLSRYGWAARMSGFRPYVVTVWGSDVLASPMKPSAATWARRTLSGAALVTGVSMDLLRAAVELGAKPNLTRVVQFGVDPERFTPGPAPADLRQRLDLEGRRVVLSPRGMSDLYRHEVAVQALAELPEDVVLVLIKWQSDPAYVAVLERVIADLELGHRVRFVPAIPHDQMADTYRLADVVVSLPRTDAFPVTALEAMACGIPIVMGDVPSALEGLGAVDPSGVVPGDDPAAVAAAVRARLELAPDARMDLGRRLRDAAIERGDVNRSLLAMERFYGQLVRSEEPS
jgi:glycosyltransferase involved in cell wall biosynthesis